ncbi:MAG: aminopeptidase, partial [Spirochaetales bacterium]|nr:aminopeptidase [Spirochaetales bacterium]
MKKTVMRKYAHLIAKCGVNVQKGQEVEITTAFDQPDFVRMVVEECYKLGAAKVIVDWTDQKTSKIHAKYRSLETMSNMEKWEKERWQHRVD